METRVTAAGINAYINKTTAEKCLSVCRGTLINLIESYNSIFFDLNEELFANDQDPDNPQPVVDLLLMLKPPLEPHIDFIKVCVRYLRILSRKQANFKYFEASTARLINSLLFMNNNDISIDCCAILLRILAFLPFLKLVLQDPEKLFTSLYSCLQSSNEDLAAAAAAAFQSFAFHMPGKQYLCAKNVHVKALSLMLERDVNSNLFNRLVGFLHNMSTEPLVVVSIRESGAINELIEALQVRPIGALTIDAAGVIQNIARDEMTRKNLLETKVIDIILQLIVSDDIQVQVRGVGAIINILGPNIDDMNSLKQALARLIALSALGRAV